MSSDHLLIGGDSNQNVEQIVRLNNGGLVMTWDDASIDNDISPQGIGMIVFDRNLNLLACGTPSVEYERLQFSGHVVATKDGFAVAWVSNGPDRKGVEDGYLAPISASSPLTARRAPATFRCRRRGANWTRG
ncbi:MAG: hypothetical protein Q4G49_17850 [Paracoccus sp. (in: a-proteobacteria)]|nr:hypothetical protein [Paracoccus sp. (in: a-proteobacteria)]